MTPYELSIYLRDYADKTKRDREEKVQVAYLLAKMFRAEMLPPLDTLLKEKQEKKLRQQTPEEMFATVKRLHTKLSKSEVKYDGGG